MAESERPLFLVTNDDGVDATGINVLAETLRTLGDVVVAAPDRERSATSHAISLDRPLRVDERAPGVFAIDGTPVDCVYLGLLHLVPRRPTLVVSGINHGYNLGSDVFYSGTVAGAVEGALRGTPAIAVSLERAPVPDFREAGRFVRDLVSETLGRGPSALPPASVLNVNLPHGKILGHRITFLGRRVYRDQVEVRQDLRGRSYYWIGGPEEAASDLPGSDLSAVKDNFASVTPLTLDLTHQELLGEMVAWPIGSGRGPEAG